jgi:hypothetical protein
MIRRKIRVPDQVDFDLAIGKVTRACVIIHQYPERRYFVVECDEEGHLAPLSLLGCDITEDRSYDVDLN